MKKLLSLLLCIVFVCFTLVGCAEDVIGEYLENYNNNKVTSNKIEKLNFYIITGDGTSNEAKITVPQNINTYLKEKYEIELNIVYCTEAEYSAKVNEALAKTDETQRPDIVLINSAGMFDAMYAANNLVVLNDFYNHRDFKSINTIVDKALLAASSVVDSETGASAYYSVPNNHLIGEYQYVVINKEMARDILHFSNEEILDMTTEDSLAKLEDAIRAYYNSNATDSGLSEDEFVNQYVSIVPGSYSDKLLLEYNVATLAEAKLAQENNNVTVNYVNINAYPNATKAEAFLSAFGIVKHLDDVGNLTEEKQAELTNHYTKCMKIIYALNTDVQLKNMLQYGYSGTNYRFEKNEKHENTNYINLLNGDAVTYQMNPIHTGNMLISYYCREINWNGTTITWDEALHENILKQNADSKTYSQKALGEVSALSIANTATAETVINLPVYGTVYSDVVLTWTSSNADVAVVSDGTLTFNEVTAKTKVTITVTATIAGIEATKEFTVEVNP